jgi:alpha-1,3-fucosyltransferase
MAAWVVSNCNATGLRWPYAVELSKYIQLDVYGQCGTMKCGKHCFRDIERKYKFYLAFEKCHCDQYLTEKVFRTLNYNIIPIVLGGANYSKILPEHSYINVEDFKSPKHLAHYMKELDENNHKYLEYFDWKRDTKAVDGRNKTIAYCRLCELLNDRYYSFKKHFNFEEFWEPDKMCLRGEEERMVLNLP